MLQISAPELAVMMTGEKPPLILDVREPWETAQGMIAGSNAIPMREIPERFEEIANTRAIVCVCHHGVRSMQVVIYLKQRGYENLYNLQGGIDAWSTYVDPSIPIY
jgi:rhodanese-related sulfurtransferase